MHWLRDVEDHWQTLIAGAIGSGLTLAAGIAAYVRARGAANTQIGTTQGQAPYWQDEHKVAAERRYNVVKWALKAAVKAEGDRIKGAVTVAKRMPIRIASSPLLRFEREDMSLLDEPTRENLAMLADILDRYNLAFEAAQARRINISFNEDAQVKAWLDQVAELAVVLQK